MSTLTDPPPTDVAVDVDDDVVEVKLNEEDMSCKSSSASTTLAESCSTRSSTTTSTDAILVDLDKDKKLEYWKKRAMKKIHVNHSLNKQNVNLREKICVLNDKNHELRHDIEENTRRKTNYLEKIELLQGEIERLKSKSRRSSIASNYSITEHEIEAVQIAKDKRELLSAGKHRELQSLIGTSFRSKWSDRFIGESRDDE